MPDLERWESRVKFMYLDSATNDGVPTPNVTIGIGCLLPDLAAAQALPFVFSDVAGGRLRVPSLAEVEWDWRRVRSMAPGNRASYYQNHGAQLYLEDAAVDDLAQARLVHGCLPACRLIFRSFDALPEGARRGIVDMIWNMGAGTLSHEFPRFIAAVNAGRWGEAAAECHRKSCREERNVWCAGLFRGLAGAPA